MTSLLKKIRGDKKGWYKVSDLVVGAEIAVPSEMGDILWDEIVSITPIKRERVYDIEVEGTHNFIGNDIFAHNTYVLRANTMLAVDGEVHAEDFVVPVPDIASASSTISQIPPSVLTADGKGVDLYKLATYNLSGIHALAEKVNAAEVRLTSLEDRMAKLDGGAVSVASSTAGTLFGQITSWLATASNGIGDLFAKAFHASEKICVDDQCLTKDDVKNLLALAHPQTASVLADQAPPADTTAPATATASTTDSGLPTSQPSTTASTTTSDLQPTTSGGDTTPPTVSDVTPPAVSDVEPPVVTLAGDAALQLIVGDAFTDPGATATDDTDGDLTSSIVVTGAVDTALAGLYELTYSATDAAGNTGSVSRVVTVLAAPVAATTTTP